MAIEDPLLTKTLKTLPGTMEVHQILAVSPENVLHRDVSCTCLHETYAQSTACVNSVWHLGALTTNLEDTSANKKMKS